MTTSSTRTDFLPIETIIGYVEELGDTINLHVAFQAPLITDYQGYQARKQMGLPTVLEVTKDQMLVVLRGWLLHAENLCAVDPGKNPVMQVTFVGDDLYVG